jgi:hypothetical protein
MRSLRAHVKNNRLLRAAPFETQNAYHASPLAGEVRPASDRAAGPPEHFLSAMIRVKDEARFLPEWLAHHLNAGVEHVYVYDDNSPDGIERVIAPFIEGGLVSYVPWPRVPASPSSNGDLLSRFGRSSGWVAFFDADELLVEDAPGALLDTLRLVRRCRNSHSWYCRRRRVARTPDAAGAADQARRTSLADAELHRHNEVEIRLPDATLRATADRLRELGYPEEIHGGAAVPGGVRQTRW